MDLEEMIRANAAQALEAQGKKSSDGSVSGMLEGAALDAVAANLLPAHPQDPARDAKDAHNADTCFEAMLAATVTYIEGSETAMTVIGSLVTLGGATAPLIGKQAAITAAVVAVRQAWMSLSARDKARIWRGGAD